MGPPEVNRTLKTLALLRKQSDEAKAAKAKADALFELGKATNELVSLINYEIYSHGFDQKVLIELAVSRCEALGIIITFDSIKKRYLYDQNAYVEYLRLTPRGAHEQEARLMVLDRTFYAQKSTDRAGIVDLIGQIERFLPRYPKEPRRSELQLYLIVLYRDLSRIKGEEPGGGIAERKKTAQLCESLIATYPETQEAKVAAAILKTVR